MKKLLALLLCFAMCLSSATLVFADDTKEVESLVTIVKERIGDTDAYENFDYHYYEHYDEKVYSLNWSTWGDEKDYKYLDVSITDNGYIYSVYKNDNFSTGSVPISERVAKDVGQKKALEFAEKLHPEYEGKFVLENSNSYAEGMNFVFSLTENGYKIRNSEITVRIDSRGENLLSAYFNRYGIKKDTKFEEGAVISTKEAIDKFNESLGFELMYSINWKWDDKDGKAHPEVTPMYYWFDDAKYISAKTGEVLDLSYTEEIEYDVYAEETMESKEMGAGAGDENSFSPAEIEKFREVGNYITPEKAFETLKKYSFIDLGNTKYSDFSISTISAKYDETPAYCFHYYPKSEKGKVMNIRIGAKDGALLYYSSYDMNEKEDKASFTEDELKSLSEKALKEIIPNKLKEFKFDTAYDSTVFYIRYANDTKTSDHTSVTFGKNKKITSFSYSYTNVDFPVLENDITSSGAVESAAKAYPYEISYIYSKADDEYKLCYAFNSFYIIVNPETGELIDYLKPKEDVTYDDISGHYCEESANILAENDIGFAGGKLDADKPISQKEFALLVRNLMRYNDGNCIIDDSINWEEYYEDFDFIAPEEANYDGTVTRIDAAMFIMRALGYIDIAKMDIYKPLYNDVTENIGYASLITGMGYMSGDGCGHFNPNSTLTRGQALIIIYNYLNR